MRKLTDFEIDPDQVLESAEAFTTTAWLRCRVWACRLGVVLFPVVALLLAFSSTAFVADAAGPVVLGVLATAWVLGGPVRHLPARAARNGDGERLCAEW